MLTSGTPNFSRPTTVTAGYSCALTTSMNWPSTSSPVASVVEIVAMRCQPLAEAYAKSARAMSRVEAIVEKT